jgi:hypothetical protein
MSAEKRRNSLLLTENNPLETGQLPKRIQSKIEHLNGCNQISILQLSTLVNSLKCFRFIF